ncbi:MAG: S41 family peptidase [Bacteroidales bacterium]|nr:S41 family peptidase [Bacteroidales bacterium]
MKRIHIIAALVLILFSSCRREADYMPYIGETGKLAYSTYSEQFEYIWKMISTGYVFWDVDTTDWDAMYERYMPRFQELDKRYEQVGYIPTSELNDLYTGVIGGLRDHHLSFLLRNLHPAPDDLFSSVSVNPSNLDIPFRDYYIESASEEKAGLLAFLENIDSQYNVEEHESCQEHIREIGATVNYHYILFSLPDGRKVPYLWQSMACITPAIRQGGEAAKLLDNYFKAIVETPRSQLAGIVLDNRDNRGGYQDDLDYLVGTYLNERVEIMKTRYKEGPGRLEHSPWTSYYLSPNQKYHRDITAENIPYVVICDIHSVSMGEIEPMVVKAVLPTGYTIGERTHGGTGPLQPADCINLNYGGPFGDPSLSKGHYVYTSSFEASIGGKVMEGIGHTPDQTVLRKDYNGDFRPQLDAALEYIGKH